MIESELQNSQYVYVLAEGLACMYMQLPDGRQQILKYVYPGDWATLMVPPRSGMHGGIRCLTDVRACRYDAGVLRDAVYARGDVLANLMNYCMEDMGRQIEHMVEIGARTSEEAVASFLLNYFRRVRGREESEGEVPFPIRLSDIADTVGITEVHAGRLFRKLQELGAIERRASSHLLVRVPLLVGLLKSDSARPTPEPL